jgi:hypothetical protein
MCKTAAKTILFAHEGYLLLKKDKVELLLKTFNKFDSVININIRR